MTLRAAMRLRRASGYSLIEVMIMVSALAVLSAVAAPAVDSYLLDAQRIRARTDVRTLAVSLIRLINDVGADTKSAGSWSRYELLIGAGDAPSSGSGAADGWIESDRVSHFDDHLLTNAVGYSAVLPNVGGWRGSYVDRAIQADPWGHRYAANIGGLAERNPLDTVVLSAGPNGVVEMPFAADGLRYSGDDISALVSSGLR